MQVKRLFCRRDLLSLDFAFSLIKTEKNSDVGQQAKKEMFLP